MSSLAQKGALIALENKVYFDLLGIHKQAFCTERGTLQWRGSIDVAVVVSDN